MAGQNIFMTQKSTHVVMINFAVVFRLLVFLVLPNCARKKLEVADWHEKKLLPEFQKFNAT